MLLLSGLMAFSQVPERVGWWKFDDAQDLLKAEKGLPLNLTGSQTSVPGPIEGNLATQVGIGSYLTLEHGIQPNLEGTLVNEYSLQIDFSLPELNKWHSFFQTSPTNENDAEFFASDDNDIGISATGYSTELLEADKWYRLIISVKNGSFFSAYIDGEKWLEGNIQSLDSRFALDNVLLVFADNDGEDETINCSELAIWDVALSESQAIELGNATTESLPPAIGKWTFDYTENLLSAEIGKPLTLTGSQISVPGPTSGNLAVQLGLGSFLTMEHDMEASLAGTKVNEYTLHMDFSVPETGKWHAFFQTSPDNSDDADLFTNTTNKIGTGATGYTENTISSDIWYRLIVSVKNGSFFRIYINGEQWLENTTQEIDGRWALDNLLLLFADDDGDDGLINCAEVTIWDKALTAEQAMKLDNPTGSVYVTAISVSSATGATTISEPEGTLQMVASITPADASKQTVTWSVENETGEATITPEGELKAVKNGTVTVHAKANDGSNIQGSMQVTLTNQKVVLITSIEISAEGFGPFDDLEIKTKGGTLQLLATILPADATTKKLDWRVIPGTGDATVDQNGLITAVKDGIVGVRATATDGSEVEGGTVVIISNQTVIRERKGLWKFDDASNLLEATIGAPLQLTGSQSSIAGPAEGNLATKVPLGSFLTMTHNIPANGGGSLVNEWALQIDFKVEAIDTWYAFIQTLDGDADLFVAKTPASDIGRVPNSIGSGSTQYTNNTISANSWYRMIISVKNGEFFRIYMNGDLWLDAEAQPIDGRFALQSTLMIFQDDDGDDGDIICSEIAIWDAPVTASEALDLGNPSKATTSAVMLTEATGSGLMQNYPNPFSVSTTVPFRVNYPGIIEFRLFDISGRLVDTYNQGNMVPGDYKLSIPASGLNNGLYHLQMISPERTGAIKIIVKK